MITSSPSHIGINPWLITFKICPDPIICTIEFPTSATVPTIPHRILRNEDSNRLPTASACVRYPVLIAKDVMRGAIKQYVYVVNTQYTNTQKHATPLENAHPGDPRKVYALTFPDCYHLMYLPFIRKINYNQNYNESNQ